MIFSYDLAQAEPVVRDVPIYAAAAGTLISGSLLMQGTTTPDSAVDMGISFVVAYTSSSAEAVDALGVLLEKTYETGGTAPTRTPVDTSGVYYGKAIINPFAIYRCEYAQAAADDVAITTGATDTSITITSLEDDIDAGWLYFPLAAGGAKGKLRAIATSAAAACVVDSAITTTTSDTVIKILPVNHRTTDLGAEGADLISAAAVGSGVNLQIVENYINSDAHVFQPLRWITHAGQNSLSNAKFYAEIALLDHIYNRTS